MQKTILRRVRQSLRPTPRPSRTDALTTVSRCEQPGGAGRERVTIGE